MTESALQPYLDPFEASQAAMDSTDKALGAVLAMLMNLYLEKKNLYAAINELDEDDRNIMFMRYVEGLSFDDIAEVVGDRPNTIAVKVHRLLKQLRQSMNVDNEQ